MGQSFTFGNTGDNPYLFNSITFQIQDRGQINEPATGITLGIYEGGSVDATDVLAIYTFGTGTFDTSNGNYVTFELSSEESNTVGLLDAGKEYTAAFTTSNAAHDFRFRRDADGAYAGGNAFWDERDFDGVCDGTLDFVFQVNVTAVSSVPEPSAIALLALGSFYLGSRCRRS